MDNPPEIRKLEGLASRKIVADQVIQDMTSAVKELVDNALDAGATIIDIKLRDYGFEGVEVSDNGHGVPVYELDKIALPHYTSKIRDFADLAQVSTLGFRGEALWALCLLTQGHLIVSTATKETAPRGTRAVFEPDGSLASRSSVARTIGTTIEFSSLFHGMPVRRKELERNIKRDYTRLLSILRAYALHACGIRICARNQIGKRPATVLFQTTGAKTMRGNYASIYGLDKAQALIDVCCVLPSEEEEEEENSSNSPELVDTRYRVEGLVSRTDNGCAKAAPDRQLWYLNGRSVDMKRLTRILTETYRTINPSQCPAFALSIHVPPGTYDVNITPDKRTILLHDERRIIEALREYFLELWAPREKSFTVQPLTAHFLRLSDRAHSRGDAASLTDDVDMGEAIPEEEGDEEEEEEEEEIVRPDFQAMDIRTIVLSQTDTEIAGVESEEEEVKRHDRDSDGPGGKGKEGTDRENDVQDPDEEMGNPSEGEESERPQDQGKEKQCLLDGEGVALSGPSEDDGGTLPEELHISPPSKPSPPVTTQGNETKRRRLERPLAHSTHDMEVTVTFPSIESLNQRRTTHRSAHVAPTTLPSHAGAGVGEADVMAAASALSRILSKEDFARFDILGQFNLGFIIVRLPPREGVSGEGDLFIVDQHAADEKYRYEGFCAEVIEAAQPLFKPKEMQVTEEDLDIIKRHAQVFRMNGYILENIDANQEGGCRVRITTQPERADAFGDVEEILGQLHADVPPARVRPERVRKKCASRACRSAVMVGKALSVSEMTRIVRHLGTLQHPWNCPHGRPTIRHLADLTVVRQVEEGCCGMEE